MAKRMTIFGVGPKIMAPTFGYLAVVGIATYLWPDIFLVHAVPYVFFLIPGVVLLAIGLPMLVVAVVSVKVAYTEGRTGDEGHFRDGDGTRSTPHGSSSLSQDWSCSSALGRCSLHRFWPTACSRCWWARRRNTFKNASGKPTRNTRHGCQSLSRGREGDASPSSIATAFQHG